MPSGNGAIHIHNPRRVDEYPSKTVVWGYISVMKKICHLIPACLANYIFSAPLNYTDQILYD